MEDGLTAAYNDFTKFANEILEKLAFNISTRKFLNLAISASWPVRDFQVIRIYLPSNELFLKSKLTSPIFIQMRIQLWSIWKNFEKCSMICNSCLLTNLFPNQWRMELIRLEFDWRDVYTETLKYLKDINSLEVEELKESFNRANKWYNEIGSIESIQILTESCNDRNSESKI